MKRLSLSPASVANWRWRLQVAARLLAAAAGGYGLAALSTSSLAALGLALGLDRVDATITATLLSFAVYAGAVVWSFGAADVTRAWCGLLLAAAPSGLMLFSTSTPASGAVVLAAIACCHAGMMTLALRTERHLRQAGAGLLAMAWAACVLAWGVGVGSAAWCGFLGLGAGSAVLVLAYCRRHARLTLYAALGFLACLLAWR